MHLPQKNSSTGLIQRPIVIKLFGLLQLTYPAFIKAQDNPELILQNWLFHLKRIPDSSIEQAMIDMIDHHIKFAPTVGEFKQLANKTDIVDDFDPDSILCPDCRHHLRSLAHVEECMGAKFS